MEPPTDCAGSVQTKTRKMRNRANHSTRFCRYIHQGLNLKAGGPDNTASLTLRVGGSRMRTGKWEALI